MNTDRSITFPEDFVWGASVSGHQVEGGNIHSNWWAWERQGNIVDGSVSGEAADYWNRFEQDHELMARLGYRAFRLGVEWARVEPEEGRFDAEAFARYRDILHSLRSKGIKICLTLHHWVLPAWVAEKEDWLNPEIVDAFLRYAGRIIDELGPYPDFWITLNEPMVTATEGNLLDILPPQRYSFAAYRTCVENQLRAHAGAYRLIHERVPCDPDGNTTRVGIAKAYPILTHWGSPGWRGWYEKMGALLVRFLFIDAWDRSVQTGRMPLLLGGHRIKGLRGSYDFCGVNYYTRFSLRFNARRRHFFFLDERNIPDGMESTDIGWQVYPEGLTEVTREVWQTFKKPILITENGIADADDDRRPRYVVNHLRALHRAIQDGVPVLGYFHWSFIDNFEWKEGFSKKFGLIAVDHRDPALERNPRPSAHLYCDIIRENGIRPEQLTDFS